MLSLTIEPALPDWMKSSTSALCMWAARVTGHPALPLPMRGIATDCMPWSAAAASTDCTVLARTGPSFSLSPVSQQVKISESMRQVSDHPFAF